MSKGRSERRGRIRRSAIATTMMFLLSARSVNSLLMLKGSHKRPLSALSMKVSQQQPSSYGLFLPSRPKEQPIHSVAAPMVAASDYAFRCLCRQYGVDLTYTQMLHAKNLLQDRMFATNHLDLYEYTTTTSNTDAAIVSDNLLLRPQQNLLNGDTRQRHLESSLRPFSTGPLIVQLAGNNVDMVVQAAQLLLERTNGQVDGIDLNCGCPQAIARKGLYGAFLVEQDSALVCDILRALRNTLPASTAVSAKIRLPIDSAHLADRVARLVDTGIDFLTIHGRTLHENKTKVGACHLDRIKAAIEMAQRLRPDFPVIANGGVETFADVARVQQETGAVAVMSSEALLETPNLFVVDSSEYSHRQVLEQQFSFARDYLDWCRLYPPLPGVLGHVGGSFNIARGHLFKFLHRYIQEHSDLRDQLASHKMTNIVQAEAFLDELYSRYSDLSDEELTARECAKPNSSWYRRHWDAASRVHQRPHHLSTSNVVNGLNEMKIEDRKAALKKRIAKLKAQRKEKKVGLRL